MKKRTFRIAIIAIALPVIGLAFLSMTSRRPDHLGVVDGKLAPPPSSPNCVQTQTDSPEHKMSPWEYSGTAAEAKANLITILEELPRTNIVESTETYLHAEAKSLLFRFVDDVEFLIDEQSQLIHFRSASRVGSSDLGVNRKRMEGLRDRFTSLQSKTADASSDANPQPE
ncbi:hypothetical protein KOR42_16110 [Thalassoglobus neptunius]|uniref:DUF1499 domain-containing protein n=1 Tax=Thalassoglobus neptunius TaxID=1938619 RepID=A0A5C5X5N5_9PLAN|nr:DUF1499 domain-containing protein [Thalassoglobus neptunius]TWT58240.1 hypothetical protein KOR42_16110 [Thalassoglobus neptunius]